MAVRNDPCVHDNYTKGGKNRNGGQRWKCRICKTTWSDPAPPEFRSKAKISREKDAQIVAFLKTGMSHRSIASLVRVKRSTVTARSVVNRTYRLHKPFRVEGGCHYCGVPIDGPKEFKRPSSRSRHMFCDMGCHNDYFLVTNPDRLIYRLRKLCV